MLPPNLLLGAINSLVVRLSRGLESDKIYCSELVEVRRSWPGLIIKKTKTP